MDTDFLLEILRRIDHQFFFGDSQEEVLGQIAEANDKRGAKSNKWLLLGATMQIVHKDCPGKFLYCQIAARWDRAYIRELSQK